MAPNILTLNGLHNSAKSADEFVITHVNSRTKGNDTASGNVVIVFGVEKDPAHIGDITKNIDNNINSRRKDKSAIGVIDHSVSDVMQPSFDSVNANDTASGNVVIVFGIEKDPTHIDNRINDSNDNNINSRRKGKSAIGIIDHAVSDAMQPNCDGINGNDTANSDAISVTGVKKDPINISSVNKNVDNSMNDKSDNKVSVIIMDFGLEPPSNVSHVIYGTGGCGVGAVDDLAIRKQRCLSGSSDADSLVFALSL